MRRVLAINTSKNVSGSRQVWMNDEFIGKGGGDIDQPMVSQILYHKGLVIPFGPANQGPGPLLEPFVTAIINFMDWGLS